MFNFENKRKMKKIVLVCIVAIMATAAQAQIYVGGTLGFSSYGTNTFYYYTDNQQNTC